MKKDLFLEKEGAPKLRRGGMVGRFSRSELGGGQRLFAGYNCEGKGA